MDIDRLSNLPDHLIHHILCFLDTKSAVQTCILSKQWRDHWRYADTLNFHYFSFKYKKYFGRFVRQVLRGRHQPLKISTLRFYSGRRKDSSLLQRLLNYAKLHEVQELETDVSNFPPTFLQCKTLKTLRIGPGGAIGDSTNTFAFASLTTLKLFHVWFSFERNNFDFFSSFSNLENLIITSCYLINFNVFNISAPQLQNLTISDLQSHPHDQMLVISAPRLKFFHYDGRFVLKSLNMDKCSVLDRVDITCSRCSLEGINDLEFISYLISMAQGLSHAKSFTISFTFIDQTKFTLRRSAPKQPMEIMFRDQVSILIPSVTVKIESPAN